MEPIGHKKEGSGNPNRRLGCSDRVPQAGRHHDKLVQKYRDVVHIHDVRTGREVRKFPAGFGHLTGFARDCLLIGNEGYDPETGKKRFELPAKPWAAAVSADGRRVLTAEVGDSTPLVWKTEE